MSYCRNNGVDSDVYVIGTREGWECLGCPEPGASFFFCTTRQEMLTHLLGHREEGHRVPRRALDRFRREIAEETSG